VGSHPSDRPPPRRDAIVQCTDLYYPGQQDPIGTPVGVSMTSVWAPIAADRLRYVVWIVPKPELFPGEWAPRLALHVNHPCLFLEVRRAPH